MAHQTLLFTWSADKIGYFGGLRKTVGYKLFRDEYEPFPNGHRNPDTYSICRGGMESWRTTNIEVWSGTLEELRELLVFLGSEDVLSRIAEAELEGRR